MNRNHLMKNCAHAYAFLQEKVISVAKVLPQFVTGKVLPGFRSHVT